MRYEGGQPLPEKRLHPLSWVFQLVGSLGAVIPIGVAVALGAERGGLFWVVVPLLLLGPLGALWHQWVYRYDFADDGLVIRHNVRRLAVGQPHDVCRAAVHPHDRRHGVGLDIELRDLGLDRGCRRLDRDRPGPG